MTMQALIPPSTSPRSVAPRRSAKIRTIGSACRQPLVSERPWLGCIRRAPDRPSAGGIAVEAQGLRPFAWLRWTTMAARRDAEILQHVVRAAVELAGSRRDATAHVIP